MDDCSIQFALKQALPKSNESKMKNICSTNIIYYYKLKFFSFFGNIIFGFFLQKTLRVRRLYLINNKVQFLYSDFIAMMFVILYVLFRRMLGNNRFHILLTKER